MMYVDTEGKFSSTRLSQMARAAAPKELSSDAALHGVLDRVGVLSPRSPEELLAALSVSISERLLWNRSCCVS